ncbi:MAG: S8 family serine peptidase, partial [Myxococcota bacterium]
DYAIAVEAELIQASFVTDDFDPMLEDALERAQAAGCVVVTAAGNDSRHIETRPVYPASFDNDSIVVVGAYTPYRRRWTRSNWGADTVDLFAPGTSILTLDLDGYRNVAGTSVAAPIVAGSIARILGEPALAPATPLAAMEVVLSSARPDPGFLRDSRSGRLDLTRAFAQLRSEAPPAAPSAPPILVSDTSNGVLVSLALDNDNALDTPAFEIELHTQTGTRHSVRTQGYRAADSRWIVPVQTSRRPVIQDLRIAALDESGVSSDYGPVLPLPEPIGFQPLTELPPEWIADGWSQTPEGLSTGPYEPEDERTLESPPLANPAPALTVSFSHRYALEDGFDFGTLETIAPDGSTSVVLSFTGEALTSVSSVTLGELEPNTRLRWRLRSDLSVQSDGWSIEWVSVEPHLQAEETVLDLNADSLTDSSLWLADAGWALTDDGAWSQSGDEPYENGVVTSATFGPLDLSEVLDVLLSVDLETEFEADRDFGFLEISLDGEHFARLDSFTGVGARAVRVYDLRLYALSDQLTLRFVASTNSTIRRSGFRIFGFKLTGNTLPPDSSETTPVRGQGSNPLPPCCLREIQPVEAPPEAESPNAPAPSSTTEGCASSRVPWIVLSLNALLIRRRKRR